MDFNKLSSAIQMPEAESEGLISVIKKEIEPQQQQQHQ